MNSTESISLLNQLILPNAELESYHNPREYLKWFLEKSYNFFTPSEQLDLANIQYYSFNHHSSKDFINGRLKGIPCLFSTKEITKSKSLQMRYDILAFVIAIGIVEKKPFQGFISTFETFKDKFIIEVIRAAKDIQIKEPVIYNPLSKILTIYIPDLYDKEFSIKHFGYLKHDLIKISGKKIGEDGLITGGEKFESFVFDFFTSEQANLFASEVVQYSEFNPHIRLLDYTTKHILDEKASYTQAVITNYMVEAGKSYEIQVGEWSDDQTGGYVLSLEQDNDDEKSLIRNQDVSGAIDYVTDYDEFILNVNEVGYYHIAVRENSQF